MNLTGTKWNMLQQFISQYAQQTTNLQLSLEDNNKLSVTAAGQTYQGSWTHFLAYLIPHITLTFTIGSTTFHYSGFAQSLQGQYGMGGSISVDGSEVGTWDALSNPAP
jgi:hypothetical protein